MNTYDNTVYDAFISYRRDGGTETARSIKESLEKRGLKVFLDFDELKTGRFDESLLRVIEHSPNFIVILTKGALDRCLIGGDWVTQEIALALKTKKNIVPIFKDGFTFPSPESLPETIKDLPHYNGLKYDDNYYNAFIDELVERMPGCHAAKHLAIGATRKDRQKASQLTILGKRMFRQGLIDDAIRCYNEALALDPDSSEAHLGLGFIALAKLKSPGEIFTAFQTAAALNTGSSGIKYIFSRVAGFLGYFKTSEAALKDALRIDPSNQSYRNELLQFSRIAEHRTDQPISFEDLSAKSGEARTLADTLLTEEEDVIVNMRWWISLLPPWRWIHQSPHLGPALMASGIFGILLLFNWRSLDTLRALQYLTISSLCFLGL
ncbi:MAG: TIR domain-containing protein [Verrucomicrobiae bacterium]|nr:TIR domain-containing protein [Verrucomicrobiae bacterium]